MIPRESRPRTDTLLAVSGVLEGNPPISPEGYVVYIQMLFFPLIASIIRHEFE